MKHVVLHVLLVTFILSGLLIAGQQSFPPTQQGLPPGFTTDGARIIPPGISNVGRPPLPPGAPETFRPLTPREQAEQHFKSSAPSSLLLPDVIHKTASTSSGKEYPVQQWVSRYDGPVSGFDAPASGLTPMAVDGAGNVYIVGIDSSDNGSYDMMTIKYDANGNQLWAVPYTNPLYPSYETPMDLAIDGIGNVYVTGYSGFNDTADTVFRVDCVTIKYDTWGNQLWVSSYHGPEKYSYSYPSGLSLDAAGNVYVSGYGYFYSGSYAPPVALTLKYDNSGNEIWASRYLGGPLTHNVSYSWWGSKPLIDASGNVYINQLYYGWDDSLYYTVHYRYNYLTVKYDVSGNQLWDALYGGPYNDGSNTFRYYYPSGAALDGSGNVYVSGTGYEYNYVDTVYFTGYVTVKYDGLGNELWVRKSAASGQYDYNYANRLLADGSGNAYVSGNYYYYDSASATYQNGMKTIKYNGSGDVVWTAMSHWDPPGSLSQYGGTALDPANNLYVSGYSYLGLGIHTGYAVAKYDSSGNERWIATYTGPVAADNPYGVAVDASGNVYVTGSSIGITGKSDFATVKYFVAYAPQVTSVSPVISVADSSVIITGDHFSPSPAQNIVYMGDIKATVTGGSSSTLTVKVPQSATYAPLSVTTGGLSGYSSAKFLPTFHSGDVLSGTSFSPNVDIATADGNPADIETADLDGDGKPDILILNGSLSTISVYKNVSMPGTLTGASFALTASVPAGTQASSMSFADMNGDGKLDIVVCNGSDHAFSVIQNFSSPGAFSFSPRVDFGLGLPAFNVAIADLDGDGQPDVVTSTQSSTTISLWRNASVTGSMMFAARETLSAPLSSAHPLTIGDIDRDGSPDIVVGNPSNTTLSVWRNANTPLNLLPSRFGARQDFVSPGQISKAIQLGDVDGDGRLDLIYCNDSSLTVCLNVTSGPGSIDSTSFTGPHTQTTGTNPSALALADFDGDGKLDIVVARSGAPSVRVFRNTSSAGSVSLNLATILAPSGTGSLGLAGVDLDGDGRPDVVSTNSGDSTYSIFKNVIPYSSYAITTSSGAHGSVAPSGSVTVSALTDTTLTITPDPRYRVSALIVDGDTLPPSGYHAFLHVIADHTLHALFEVDSPYTVSYRTFTYDSLLVAKAVKKKPVTAYWEFLITNSSGAAVSEVNLQFNLEVKEMLSSGALSPVISGKSVKLSGPLAAGESFVLKGRSVKAKPTSIAKMWFGPVAGASQGSLLPQVQTMELPLPNTANVRDEAFSFGGFGSTAGLVVGIPRPDAPKSFGWVQIGKSKDLYKSLTEKGLMQTGDARGLDVFTNGSPIVKLQKSLSPVKHSNHLFGNLLALKLNIALSAMQMTEPGLGELIFDQSGSAYQGMLIRDIATKADSLMTYHILNPALYADLDSAVSLINSTFSGPLAVQDWTDSLQLTGVRALLDVSYLKASSIPPRIVPRSVHEAPLPADVVLDQNYPNPFNPRTRLSFEIGTSSFVSLKIYDILGREVTTLFDHELMDEGTHEAEFDGSNAASGVYFYRIVTEPFDESAAPFTQMKKMILIK